MSLPKKSAGGQSPMLALQTTIVAMCIAALLFAFSTFSSANTGIANASAGAMPASSAEPLTDCTFNIAWVTACDLTLGTRPDMNSLAGFEQARGIIATQSLDQSDQSRWYKFSVEPNSKVIIQLTNLPANYDLTLYKDIPSSLEAILVENLSGSDVLSRLGAEFAPDAFSPDAFSPDAFSPDAFSPDAFSPDAFSPDAFSPDVYAPDAFSPDAFSPDAFSPDAFSPDAFYFERVRNELLG